MSTTRTPDLDRIAPDIRIGLYHPPTRPALLRHRYAEGIYA